MRTRSLVLAVVACAFTAAEGQKIAKLTEDLRLDATKEDFARINSVVVGPKGQMAVVNGRESQILLYDSNGRRIGVIGRAGAGPGEFRTMSSVGWIADTLWAHDYSLMRVTFVGPDAHTLRVTPMPNGSLAGSAAVSGSPFGMMLLPRAIYGDGSMLISGLAVPTGATSPLAKRFSGFMTSDGAITRIANAPNSEDKAYIMTIAGSSGYRSVPLAVPPSVLVPSDGSRYGFFTVENSRRDGGVTRISSFRRDGALEFAKEIPFTGVPVPSRLRDSLIASQNRWRPGSEIPKIVHQEYEDMARERIPRVYPEFDGASFGLDGSVWLHVRSESDPNSFLVLDTRGREVGRLTLPPRSSLSQASLSRAWVVERDKDDLPSVVRYRITWP